MSSHNSSPCPTMIQEAGGYRAWLSSCSKNIITHFKAIGCLSSDKVRALMCTLMDTGWPLSNRDGRHRRASKMKPAAASPDRTALNPSHKQNASSMYNLPRLLSFLTVWQPHCCTPWACTLAGIQKRQQFLWFCNDLHPWNACSLRR